MRVFNHMNQSGKDVCPICKTKKDEPTVLIAIDGTVDGGNEEAMQVHLECLRLRFFKGEHLIYQKINNDAISGLNEVKT